MSTAIEVRATVKEILKNNNIDPKTKFKVHYVSFQDLARGGAWFVEFDDLHAIELGVRCKMMDEIKYNGLKIG